MKNIVIRAIGTVITFTLTLMFYELYYNIVWYTLDIYTSGRTDEAVCFMIAVVSREMVHVAYSKIVSEIERRRVRANFLSVEEVYD